MGRPAGNGWPGKDPGLRACETGLEQPGPQEYGDKAKRAGNSPARKDMGTGAKGLEQPGPREYGDKAKRAGNSPARKSMEIRPKGLGTARPARIRRQGKEGGRQHGTGNAHGMV